MQFKVLINVQVQLVIVAIAIAVEVFNKKKYSGIYNTFYK